MEKYKTHLIVIGSIFGLLILLIIAQYFSSQKQIKQEEAKRVPIKQLVAKEGTERANAKALTSSQAKLDSPDSESIDKEKIWGDLENPKKKRILTRTEQAIQKASEADTPEEAIRILLKRLEEMDGNQQKSLLFSSLSTYYPSLDPPMHDEAEKAHELAWRYTQTKDEEVLAAFHQADYHMAMQNYPQVIKDIDRLGTDTLPITQQALEISMMLGIAHEQLGATEEAKASYKHLMKEARNMGLQKHKTIANIYRQAGMKLALLYQHEGNTKEAHALARSVQEAIAF